MDQRQAASVTATVAAALLVATAAWHLSGTEAVASSTPAELQPLMKALWLAAGTSLLLTALLVVAVTPVFIVRRRALLWIAALTPLSIAVLQLIYLGFIPPTAMLLLDALVVAAAGQLAPKRTPTPGPAA